jgi:hypothetical protein
VYRPQPSRTLHLKRTQSTPTTPSTKTVKPTYAAVLKSPPQPHLLQLDPKSPPLTPRSSSPYPSDTLTAQSRRNSLTPTLTVEDLHKRFHNKPSPLKPTRPDPQPTKTLQYNVASAATDSLSKFLLSVLPAFTRFLSDIQGGQYNRHTLYRGAGRCTSTFGFSPGECNNGHERVNRRMDIKL